MKAKFFFIISFLGFMRVYAQGIPVSLPTVSVDIPLRDASATQQLQMISDSVVVYNRPFLTSLLEYQTPLAFKQNGFGMVSSVTMRGTTAQQTAVVWNGIPINSQFNGQTDFSTIIASDYQSVTIRGGGGSVLYGSSAIGGTVHLQNTPGNSEGIQHRLLYRTGSFSTNEFLYRLQLGYKKIGGMLSISYNASENDYPLPNQSVNQNGAYSNLGINGSWKYKLHEAHTLHFFHRLYGDDRQFSLINTSETPTYYKNLNSANQLVYSTNYNNFSTNLRVANVFENYRFFASPDTDVPEEGTANTWLTRLELVWKYRGNLSLNLTSEYNNTVGEGTYIVRTSRDITSFSGLLAHKVTGHLHYEVGLRKEITAAYSSPLLYSAGIVCQTGKHWKIRANASKNFRIPSFNDLYWTDSGNPSLLPETAHQVEVGQEFSNNWGNLKTTFFYINTDNLIQWVPTSGFQWSPLNYRNSISRGIEVIWSADWQLKKTRLTASSTYSYTDAKNTETGKRLIYVPMHRGNANISAGFKHWSAWLQGVFSGEVPTRSDNNSRYNLAPFVVANIGVDCKVLKNARLGVQIFNLANQYYQTVEGRYMPGRYFQVLTHLNF